MKINQATEQLHQVEYHWFAKNFQKHQIDMHLVNEFNTHYSVYIMSESQLSNLLSDVAQDKKIQSYHYDPKDKFWKYHNGLIEDEYERLINQDVDTSQSDWMQSENAYIVAERHLHIYSRPLTLADVKVIQFVLPYYLFDMFYLDDTFMQIKQVFRLVAYWIRKHHLQKKYPDCQALIDHPDTDTINELTIGKGQKLAQLIYKKLEKQFIDDYDVEDVILNQNNKLVAINH